MADFRGLAHVTENQIEKLSMCFRCMGGTLIFLLFFWGTFRQSRHRLAMSHLAGWQFEPPARGAGVPKVDPAPQKAC